MTSPHPKLLQPALKALDKDLLARARTPRVEAGLRAAWDEEQKQGQTGLGFDPWRREHVTQIAAAWVLSLVFVRTLEDRGLIDPRVAGPDKEALRAAEDREKILTQLAPFLGPREYLLTVFKELAKLPGARHVFDTRHNPVWQLSPSNEGAKALLEFFRKTGADGRPVLAFPDTDTRFLGDLYQYLSEEARERYALLQTPDFVEEFILEQTLEPAIQEYGLAEVRLIDPTCGSGHFLLGAFRRLLARWQAERPMGPVETHARKALDQVYGVDINAYAVAIARFRLVLAVLDAVGIKRLDKAPDLRPNLVVADSLLHRFKDDQLRLSGQLSFEEAGSWGDTLFRLEDRAEVERVLTKRFHAVVGNPPYITEKDSKKREQYRKMYVSAAGKYALAAPFTERFFRLATEGGFVGLINSNAWTKRDYGKALIEEVLPELDVQKIVDTSGCYIPGHGTPTLLLFGRNRAESSGSVMAVLGKRGEREEPTNPSNAPVWSEIVTHHDKVGFEGQFVSIEAIERADLARHPWVLAGGGVRFALRSMESKASSQLSAMAVSIGFMAITGEDEAFARPHHAWLRAGASRQWLRGFGLGTSIRDWETQSPDSVLFPYMPTGLIEPNGRPELLRLLWPLRSLLHNRPDFSGKRYVDVGRPWYEFHQIPLERLRTPLSIAFGEVATHNHFILDRGGKVFNRTAPIIKLRKEHDEADHQAVLGYLNSSTMAFWGRLVFFQKGGDQVGEGARLSKTPWQDRLQMSGNLMGQLPVPDLARLRATLLDFVIAAEDTVRRMGETAPDKALATALDSSPTLTSLSTARDRMVAERARLRGILVSLQEEMDWRVYGLFGLPTVTAPSVNAVSVTVAPEHRPFEVRLAREVGSDISAAEWFRVHQRNAPADVGGPLADLYRQRLRLLDDPVHGKDLRLLETPENKRRWSPVDDAKAFTEAAQSWLLERVEQVFREQSQPELLTARQLALELGRDPRVRAVHELLTETSSLDLVRLLSDLLDPEGVPFLAALRYTETGLEKRKGWEECWELQRAEDAGTLAAMLREKNLKAIPVPDKYAPADFQRHYWGLRGALDVPKERFITVPVGNNDDDLTPLVGWAGWDHLQAAQALSGLYQRRKNEDGWDKKRLQPLLAGIDERLPWLLQWHNEPSEAFGGMKLGDFFRDFVAGEAHSLGVSLAELRAWRPEATPKGRGRKPATGEAEVLAALLAWSGEVDPRPDDLAERVGASKAAVSKLLKALVESGQAVQTSGRPARYRRT